MEILIENRPNYIVRVWPSGITTMGTLVETNFGPVVILWVGFELKFDF